MASDHDVQDFSTSFKKRKIEHISNLLVEKDTESNFTQFSQPSEVSSVSLGEETAEKYSNNTDQVLNSADSGFSEIGVQDSNIKNRTAHYSDYEETSMYDNVNTSARPPQSSDLNQSLESRDEMGDEDDEISSTISDLSGISGLSGQDWKPTAGAISWVQRQMANGADPRELLSNIVQDDSWMSSLPPAMDDLTLWKIIINMLTEPPRRKKLSHINTMSDFVNLLKTCKNIVVLTGAGVSVSCGIPDFRSHNGIYSRLAVDFPDLPDPQAMFDINYFNKDPRPFYKFAKEIYPGKFSPSPCHKFIKVLERKGKLLRNYTQNIDTLEQVTGIKNVIQCHGSFATASCTKCKHKVSADDIRNDIFTQNIPVCKMCTKDKLPSMMSDDAVQNQRELVENGIMKPDIVFFGEGLPDDFHEAMAEDKDKCDLLIVIGSSLKVLPVALIPSSVPTNVPQILINREPLEHFNFDVELLGNGDVIIDQLCRMLGEDWQELCWREESLIETRELLPEPKTTPTQQTTSDINKNCRRKRSLNSEDGDGESSCKRMKMNNEHVDDDTLTQSLRDVRVCSVDSMLAEDEEEEGDKCCENGCDCCLVLSASVIKERQISMDSTRDSGISDTNKDTDRDEDEGVDDCNNSRVKISYSTRLPANTYYFTSPNRYVFEGGEVYPSRRLTTTNRRSRYSDHDDDDDDDDEDEDEEAADDEQSSSSDSLTTANTTTAAPATGLTMGETT